MTDRPPQGTVKRIFGAALMAIGGLIALLSGLCSLVFAFGSMFKGEQVFGLVISFAVGIVPILSGVGLFFLGRHLRR